MSTARPSLIAALFVLAACAQAPAPNKALRSDLAQLRLGTSDNDRGVEVAVNRYLEAVFVVGSTEGSLDGPSKGGSDGFLRRYRRDGSLVWRVQFGSPYGDYAGGVATDRVGNVYVANTAETPYSPSRAVLGKYSQKGNRLWTRTLGMSDSENTEINGIVTDEAGNVYVAVNTFTQFLVRKYSSSGAVLWTRSEGTWAVKTQVEAMTTDGDGNLYMGVGEYDDELFSSTVVKYSGDGTLLWGKAVGNNRGVTDLRVVGGALYAAGYKTYFEDTVPTDAYAAKFSLDGSVLWDKTFGTSAWDRGTGVTADGSGNAYITGYTTGALVGGSAGGADGFVRKYGPSGSVIWTKQFGSDAFDYPEDLVAYNSGELYLTGITYGKLGPAHRGGTDAFLRRLDGSGRVVWTD